MVCVKFDTLYQNGTCQNDMYQNGTHCVTHDTTVPKWDGLSQNGTLKMDEARAAYSTTQTILVKKIKTHFQNLLY